MLFGEAYVERQGTLPPPRPPTDLPNPGDLVLHLRLGEKVGSGGSGRVYEALVAPERSSPLFAATPPIIPPLVVKISRRGRANKLANEAYYYDFCNPLQGVSLPRFYGHFRAELPDGIQLPRLADDDYYEEASEDTSGSSSQDSSQSGDNEQQPGAHGQGSSLISDLTDEQRAWSWAGYTPPPSPPHPEDSDVEETETGPTAVSVLVMERLGGFLPIAEELPDSLL